MKGYLTVWLALCLTIIVSLFLVLMDGVRRNGAALEAGCVAEIGLQSIMAEYHRELLEQYNIFAIDASYGTAMCSKSNTEQHLKKYLEKNLSTEDIFLADYLYRDFLALGLGRAELNGMSILTDGGGAVFRSAAIEAIENDVGLGLLEELREWMRVIEINGLEEKNAEEEKSRLDARIESYNDRYIEVEKDQWEKFEVINPTDELEKKRSQGILKLVLEDETQLSQRTLETESLIMNRMQQGEINQGNMEPPLLSEAQRLAERFLFQEYLLKYMGRYGCGKAGAVLQYQAEYLVSGKNSDIENLRSVAGRICAIREAANLLYLLGDEEKKTVVEGVSELACSLLMVPELAPLLELTIYMGWAFAESVYDVKSMLAGGRIPLIKDDDSWHYGLTAALWGSLGENTKDGEGLSYADYLRIFMMFTDLDTLTGRAMNMVEADIRATSGNSFFRLDGCYVAVEVNVLIESKYGYQYEIKRRRSY